MKKILGRASGNVVSLLAGTKLADTYLPIPNGVAETTFITIAAISSLVGYNFGTWLGSNQQKRAIIGFVLAVLVIPGAYFAYDAVLDRASGGLLVVAALYFLFAIIFVAVFCAFGILQVRIFQGT